MPNLFACRKAPRLGRRLVSVFLLFFALGLLGAQALALPPEVERDGVVARVIDGDTFDLAGGERVRLIGVDAPEYQPWKNKRHFYGKDASDYLRELLKGKRVFLETDIQPKDKYGRTLAYVYLENGTLVNELLVRQGYARAKVYRPNNRHFEILKTSEKEAKTLKKGLWTKPRRRSLLK